jgi:hypothetical protein
MAVIRKRIVILPLPDRSVLPAVQIECVSVIQGTLRNRDLDHERAEYSLLKSSDDVQSFRISKMRARQYSRYIKLISVHIDRSPVSRSHPSTGTLQEIFAGWKNGFVPGRFVSRLPLR